MIARATFAALLLAVSAHAEAAACLPEVFPSELKLSAFLTPSRQILLDAVAVPAGPGEHRWTLSCRLPTGAWARFQASQRGADALLVAAPKDADGLLQVALLSIGTTAHPKTRKARAPFRIGLRNGQGLVLWGAEREAVAEATLRLDVDERRQRAALVLYPSPSFAPAVSGASPPSPDALTRSLVRAFGEP